jgi:two-component system, NarL family, nitrate/nitrite response regulator NarL
MSIGIVIADRYPIVLDGLSQLIAGEPDLEILATCTSGPQALEAVRETGPDVLLTSLNLTDLGGLELLRRLRAEGTSTRCIFFVGSIRDDEVLEAMRLRVEGILLKDMPTRLILQCIRKVHEGGRWLETESMARVFDQLQGQEASQGDLLERLSPREQDVVRHVLEGLNNKDIAAALSLSVGTVKIHLHNVYEKLGLRSRLQLATYAREKGFGPN